MTDDELREAAACQLRANLRRGVSSWNGRPYSFCVPSNVTYPYQWFWDSCFHAVVWSHIDIDQAKEELRTLLRAQKRNGRIPHRIAWESQPLYPYRFYLHSTSWRRPVHSCLVQPPLLAQAIEVVYQRSGDRAFLEETLEPTERFYRWLADHRDPDGDGLVSIIHPYESGLDHKPSFDVVFGFARPSARGATTAVRLLDIWNRLMGYNLPLIFRLDRFNVTEVLFNCAYAHGVGTLARLWRALGDPRRAANCERWQLRVEAAILDRCRGPDGLYYDLYSRGRKMAIVKTVSCLMPLLLDSISREAASRLLQEHLLNEGEFWLPYPLPTVAADEPSFNPSFRSPRESGLWRGPTWLSTNWLILKGLLKHGFDNEARHVVASSRELVDSHGFREFYDPYTGQAYGAPGFGSSTLVVDMLALVRQ
jgi:glycogen debranching enzyme